MCKYRRLGKYAAMALAVCLLCGCSVSREEEKDMSIVKGDEEKGYDLPVDSEEREEAEADCGKMLEKVLSADPEIARSGTVLAGEKVVGITENMAESGDPIAGFDIYYNMKNYEKMDRFLQNCGQGREGCITEYELSEDGGIVRKKFIFDGTDMYLLAASASWKDDAAVLGEITYTRIREWTYTRKGWFFYELCAPEYPEVTEPIYSRAMLRVLPCDEEYAETARKWLKSIGYNGNNLLCSDWDAEHMEDLDYNGLFEYLYELEYGRTPDTSRYADGIPGEEFEKLMTRYLPVEAEQVREYASYDAERNTYDWIRLGVGNRTLGVLVSCLPEVVDMQDNGDGTVTLTLDAVCESTGDDAFLAHKLTVRFEGDDDIKFLSNTVEQKELLPEYVYRIQEK